MIPKPEPVDLVQAFAGLIAEARYRRYRELWDRAERFEILTSFPMHLDIELSGLCNLRCGQCFQNGMISGPLGLMDESLFRRLIDESTALGLCGVKLQIRGESLLHPGLFDCIAHAKAKGVMDVQLTTNGTLFDQEKIEKILASGLDAIVISYDEHHDRSISTRPLAGGRLAVGEAVDLLLEQRKKLGRTKPMVRLQTTISEAESWARDAARERLSRRFPLVDVFNINRLTSMADSVDAYPDLHDNYELLPCSYPFLRLAVFYNGEVTVCCMDYNLRLKLGSYPGQSIAEIWKSGKLQAFRDSLLIGKRPDMPICRHCHAHLSAKDQRLFVHKVEKFDYGKTTQHRRNERQG